MEAGMYRARLFERGIEHLDERELFVYFDPDARGTEAREQADALAQTLDSAIALASERDASIEERHCRLALVRAEDPERVLAEWVTRS